MLADLGAPNVRRYVYSRVENRLADIVQPTTWRAERTSSSSFESKSLPCGEEMFLVVDHISDMDLTKMSSRNDTGGSLSLWKGRLMIDILHTRRRIYGMWARLRPSENMPQGMVSTCNIKTKMRNMRNAKIFRLIHCYRYTPNIDRRVIQIHTWGIAILQLSFNTSSTHSDPELHHHQHAGQGSTSSMRER